MLAIAWAFLGTGCKKDNFVEVDGVCPIIVSTSPANGETAVALGRTITATFNEAMNPATFTDASFMVQGGAPIAGVITFSGQTASFRPASLLLSNTTYVATITRAVKDPAGNALQTAYVWTFSTDSFLVPMVISTNPANGDIGVPLNKVVTATFNLSMDPLTINGSTFQLSMGATSIAGTVTLTDTTAFFTPTVNLVPDTVYTATISAAATSLQGVPMTAPHVWTFRTGTIVAPIVISTDPVNNEVGVGQNKVLSAQFSMPMNTSTLNTSTFILRKGSTIIPGATTASGAIVTFTPSSQLLTGTVYTATITTGAQNLAGVSLANNYVWTFTTLVIPGPTVIAVNPLNNAVGVPVNQIVMATFNEPMDPLTLVSSNYTLRQGTNNVAGTVSRTSTTISFTPSSNLISGVLYTATITTGVKNLAGISMANTYIWEFTTIVLPPPTVIATDPVNLATNVPLNQVVTATFSVPMNPATINGSTFTLKRGNVLVLGSVNYNGTTAFFTPNNNLRSDTTYTATITTGAQNTAGVAVVNDYVWSFNTVQHLGPPGVDLGSAGRFGILAGVGVSNMAGFSEIRNMDVGIYPGARSSIVGFPPAIVVNGAIFASDDVAPPGVAAMLLNAKNDLTAAYLFAESQTLPAPATVSGDLGGLTLAPGIYKTTSTLLIQSGDLTLDAQGDVNAIWIFQIASGFTTVGGAGGNVILAGGAKAGNVYWQTGSSATIGDYTSFQGNILALTSITMNAYSTAVGRMLCRNAAVVMTSTNIISKP